MATRTGLTDNTGDYRSYERECALFSWRPGLQVVSDLAYVTGRVHTGKIRHDISFGTTGYRFASWSPVTSPAKTALCTAQGICQANIADPVDDVIPAGGVFSYTKTSPSTGIYVSSIIHQQGLSLSDEIMLTSKWFARVGASQDWTWVNTYGDSASTGFLKTPIPGGYSSQGVSPTASIGFKPRADMTIYASFVDSDQAAGRHRCEHSYYASSTNSGLATPPAQQQRRRDRLQAAGAEDQFLHGSLPPG